MHDGMQYDPIQGQGQGNEPLKVGNWAVFKGYLLRSRSRLPVAYVVVVSA